MPRSQPGQPHSENIFTQTEADVRKRFRRGRNRSSRGSLAPVSGEGDYGSQQSGEQLLFRRERLGGFVSDQSGSRNPHERVQRIPDQIKRRNLISEKLNEKQRAARANNHPVLKYMQPRRQRHMPESPEQSEKCHRGINI